MYSLKTKGYATFGALGQGPSNSKNVDDNTSNQMRTMIVTVMPGSGFNQGGKTVKFEVGSYPWNSEYDLTIPQIPFIYGYTHPIRENESKLNDAFFVRMAGVSALSAIAFTLF